MFSLDLDVKMRIDVPESVNERLEQGDQKTFKGLEDTIKATLETFFKVHKLQIEDAGPHNVVYSDNPPSKE